MRCAALFVLVLMAAGCGSAPAKHPRSLPRPDSVGHWTKVLPSPDGATLLAQWSGECEIQTAYLADADNGKPRPVTDYGRGSAQSIALGWAGSKARVRLPQGQPPSRKPGVYLVDPKTMAMTLERPAQQAHGC